MSRTIGLVVNPVAGIGGPAGLKGSDGEAVQMLAAERGAVPQSVRRASQALALLPAGTRVLTAGGAMGEVSVRAAGLEPVLVHPKAEPSHGSDTTAAVTSMLRAGAQLIVFAGGDGTARDVAAGLSAGESTPVLGIPAGVKMYSSCFAVSPSAAGRLLADWCSGATLPLEEREVLDISEEQVQRGIVEATLHSLVQVPVSRGRTQARKAPSTDAADVVRGVARGVVRAMRPGEQYFLGPGGTMRAVAGELGVAKTPLGVDVVRDGRLIAADADERTLLRLAQEVPSHAVVTIIGGQGFLLGRGNQQLSAAVVRELREPRLIIGATHAKLLSHRGPLLVDTGDDDVDTALTGHARVIIGQHETAVVPVMAAGTDVQGGPE